MKPLSEAGLSEKDARNIAAAWLLCPAGDNNCVTARYKEVHYPCRLPQCHKCCKRFEEVKKRVRALVFGADDQNSKNTKKGKNAECIEDADDDSGCSIKKTATPKSSNKAKHSVAATKHKIGGSAGTGGPAGKRVKAEGFDVTDSEAVDKVEGENHNSSLWWECLGV